MTRRSPRSLASAGFTIVELMIVLAIASLILLIVLEALPALERSSRNNARKQDVNVILGAISHYELNDSGSFPDLCGNNSGNACSRPTSGNNNFLQYVESKMTYYTDSTSVVATPQSVNTGDPNYTKPQGPNTSLEVVNIYNYEKCDPNTQGAATPNAAGYNDVVALFAIETGSGISPQCQQL